MRPISMMPAALTTPSMPPSASAASSMASLDDACPRDVGSNGQAAGSLGRLRAALLVDVKQRQRAPSPANSHAQRPCPMPEAAPVIDDPAALQPPQTGCGSMPRLIRP